MRQGQHRQLDEIRVEQGGIDERQRRGIDHVFGVVQNHHPRRRALARFVHLKRAKEPVQAVGLAGRPRAVVNDDPHPAIAAAPQHGRGKRGEILSIATDVEAQAALRPGFERMPDRRGDDAMLAPGGYEHRAPPRQRPTQKHLLVDVWGADPARQSQPDIGEIERQLVERTDQEEGRGEQDQLVPRQHEPVARRQIREAQPLSP